MKKSSEIWPKRPIGIVVWVEGEIQGYGVVSKHSKRVPACWDIPDPYEKRLIDEKMARLPTRRYGAYLRKMAIDGYIIQLDTTDIKRMNAALSAIGRNINQIAKRVNAGGGAYKADMREIQERLDEIWQLQRRILSSQR